MRAQRQVLGEDLIAFDNHETFPKVLHLGMLSHRKQSQRDIVTRYQLIKGI